VRPGVVYDLLQLPRRCVVNPFFAALRTNRGFHFSHYDDSAAEVGAKGGFAFGLFAATDWANLARAARLISGGRFRNSRLNPTVRR